MSEWRTIESAPKDGTWFLIGREGEGPEFYEVGRYNRLLGESFHETEPGSALFRRTERTLYEWQGFNNFHAATHWQPLPEPPKP